MLAEVRPAPLALGDQHVVALRIAADHVAHCRRQGLSAIEALQPIGIEARVLSWDDVVTEIAVAWLGLGAA